LYRPIWAPASGFSDNKEMPSAPTSTPIACTRDVLSGIDTDRVVALWFEELVNDTVIVETKSVEKVLPVHCAQLLSYMRLTDKRLGLLVNFNVPCLLTGVKRIVNKF